MKLVVRVFALSLVVAGAVAASSMPKGAPAPISQVISASQPAPMCNPAAEFCTINQ